VRDRLAAADEMTKVSIDTRRITDWNTFHSVFAELLGFPSFYGRNMNAWIDCMTYIDDRAAGMSSLTVEPGQVLTLELEDATGFSARCPEQFAALLDCAAFVNWRRIEQGESSVLAVAYQKAS
jgi:hypothetical protein